MRSCQLGRTAVRRVSSAGGIGGGGPPFTPAAATHEGMAGRRPTATSARRLSGCTTTTTTTSSRPQQALTTSSRPQRSSNVLLCSLSRPQLPHSRPGAPPGALSQAVRWASHSTASEGSGKRREGLPSGLPFERYEQELAELEQLTKVPVFHLAVVVSAFAAAGKHDEIVTRLQALVPRLSGSAGSFGLVIQKLQDVTGSVGVAFDVMRKAIEITKNKVGGAPDARAYQCLIRVCAQQGDFNDALRVGQLMENNGVEFTSGIYDSLINACALSSAEKLDSALFDPPIPSGHITAAAVAPAGRHPALGAAFSLVKDMHQRGMAPDRRIYCSLMHVCLSHGDVAAMRSTFDDMRQADIQPDIYAFTALMRGCAIERNLEGAMRVLTDMRRARVTPTIFTYSVVLNLCAQLADSSSQTGSGVTATDASVDGLAVVEQVLARMEQQHIALNLVSYNTLIKACANSVKAASAGSDWRRSVEILDKALSYIASMKTGGINPDAATFNSLLQLCSYGPQLQERATDGGADGAQSDTAPGQELADAAAKFDCAVDEIMREMNDCGVRPDGTTATLLISHFSERDPLKAFAVLTHMKQAGVKPYLPSFTALITACRHFADPSVAERMAFEVLDELKQAGLTPTATIFNAIMAVMPQRAPEVVKMMREHYLQPTAFTNNQLIYSLAQRLSSASESENENVIGRRFAAKSGHIHGLELLEQAFAVADRLKRSPAGPETVAYSHLLYACGAAARLITNRARQSQQPGEAKGKLDPEAKAELRRVIVLADQCWANFMRHQPSSATHNDFLTRMRLCLRRIRIADDAADATEGLRSALETFDEMQRRGIRPNPISYGALVRACARHGDYGRLLQLVEDMRSHGVQPTAAALGDTILTLSGSQSDEAQAALSALSSMTAGQPASTTS